MTFDAVINDFSSMGLVQNMNEENDRSSRFLLPLSAFLIL